MTERLLITPPQEPLSGSVSLPGDKSVTHRALMLAAIAQGDTELRGAGEGADNQATLAAVEQLGVEVLRPVPGIIVVRGVGLYGLKRPQRPIDCANSGTTARLLAGLLAGAGVEATLTGDESLSRRPMARIADPLNDLGLSLQVSSRGTLPLTVRSAADMARQLEPARAVLRVASAQVKSAILFASLYRRAVTEVVEPEVTRDHSERLLRAFGVRVASSHHYLRPQAAAADAVAPFVRLEAPELLRPRLLEIPGDLSSAAFLLAAAVVTGGKVTVTGCGVNPTRIAFLTHLQQLGARVTLRRNRVTTSGEPVADVTVAAGPLKPRSVGGAAIPLLIDELPLVALLAALCEGETRIDDAAELRVKESDRLATTLGLLKAMQVDCEATEQGLIIRGRGGRGWPAFSFDAAGDHRLAMAAAVAALGATGPCTIDGAESIKVSYPGFFDALIALGAHVERSQS